MSTTKSATIRRRVRVLIVDDHELVRRGLAALLDDDPRLKVCGQADGIAAAMKIVKTAKPKVIIIDISLKDGNGLELIKQVHDYDDAILMLVSSMHDESLYAERVLRAGASGYVHKEQAAEKVLDAIHTVLDGGIVLSPRLKQDVLLRLAGERQEKDQSEMERLSDRELQVFELIGRGRTTREIAEQLKLSTKTIETYRDNIRAKLHLETGAALTCRAVRWIVEQQLG